MEGPDKELSNTATSPGAELAVSLGLIALFFLPLADGGYSGTGYQVGLVLLPLAAAIAWAVTRWRSPLATVVVFAFLLMGITMVAWVNPGRLLWFYILAIPCAWVLTSLMLTQGGERAKWLWPAVVGSAVLTAIYGWYLLIGNGTIHYQIVSTFGLHNSYAGFLLIAWPLAMFAAAREERRAIKIAYYCAGAFLALTLVLTYSKASWVMFFLQLLLVAVLGFMQLRKGKLAGNRFWIAAGGAVAAGLALLALPPVQDALSRITDFSGYSMQGRLKFWSAALGMFRDHPLLGVGPGNFAFYYPQYQVDYIHFSVDPHSWPLQLLAELGGLGLLILLAVLAGTGLWAWKLLRATGFSIPAGLLVAAVLGSLAHAAFDFDYTFTATTALLGLVLACGTYLAQGAGGAPEGVKQPGWVKGLAIASVAMLLVYTVVGELYTTERYNLDRLRTLSANPAASAQQQALRANLLRQCIKANKYNYSTQYQLASMLLQPGQGDAAHEEGEDRLERAIELNPRYPRSWALKGLIAKTPAEREELLQKAIELDPYNYPEHYWHYATLARDPEVRKARLLEGMEHIEVTEPITPEHVRPTWYELNPLFSQWWEELAQLEDDPELKTLYRQRAARIKVYWQGQTESLPGEGNST